MRRHRRSLSLSLAVPAMALLLGGAGARAADPVVIGAALPLSGPMSLSGQNAKDGIDLAVEAINKNGGIKSLGGAQLKVIYADTTADPSTGANVVARMISRENPVAIQGAYGSSITLAATEVSERQRIPFLTMSFSDQIVGRGYRYVFQVVATATAMGKAQLQHTVEMAKAAGEDLKSIAIVFEDTAFGKSQAEGIKKTAEEMGLGIALYETYGVGLTDATSLANKIKAAQGQAIFINSTISDAVLIMRALRQLGVDAPVIAGGGGFLEPDFYKAVKEDSEGILVEAPALARGPLDEAHRAKKGTFLSHAGFEHAIITEIIAAALEETKSRDPEELAKALRKMTFTAGNAALMPGGGVKFDERGANAMTYSIMAQWQGGELVPVWPSKEASKAFKWRGKEIARQ